MANWKASSAPFISIIAVLLVVFAVTGATAWESKCATFDEPLHLVGAWLQTYHGDFRCDPEDPPLWRYYVALGAPSGELELSTSGAIYDAMLKDRAYEGQYVKNNFYYTAANDSDSVLGRARERMVVLAVLLGGVIAWWSWRLGGAVAAVVAAAGFCFDPNFLAHGPLVKDDVPMSLALLAFMAAVWMVGKRVTPIRVAAVAILLGVALTVKFSGILAVPILGICLLLRALLPEAWPTLKSTAATRGKRLGIAAGIFGAACVFAYGFVWACYRFRYAPGADPNQLLDFRSFCGSGRGMRHSGRTTRLIFPMRSCRASQASGSRTFFFGACCGLGSIGCCRRRGCMDCCLRTARRRGGRRFCWGRRRCAGGGSISRWRCW